MSGGPKSPEAALRALAGLHDGTKGDQGLDIQDVIKRQEAWDANPRNCRIWQAQERAILASRSGSFRFTPAAVRSLVSKRASDDALAAVIGVESVSKAGLKRVRELLK